MNKKIILIILLLTCGCMMKSKKPKHPPRPKQAVIKKVETENNSIEKLKSYPQLYALYNIHVDHIENRVFTLNYQLPGLVIPICTKVTIVNYNNDSVNFKDENGKSYIYLSHRAVKERIGDHLTKVFGPNCHKKEMTALIGIDKDGIKKGKALVGMTKKGVLYAIGNPPANANKVNLENSNEWFYWRNRWNRFSIVFNDKGIVKSIKNFK